MYAVTRPSVICQLSVTFVHPTQPVEIFGNFSMPFGTLAIPARVVRWLDQLSACAVERDARSVPLVRGSIQAAAW